MVYTDSSSQDQLEQLQRILVSGVDTAGSMSLDMAHGFLAATAALPGADPSALLDQVMGGLCADQALRERLLEFREQLLTDLRAAEFGALVLQLPRDKGDPLPLPYGWCQGFVSGIGSAGETWRRRIVEDQHTAALLAPVFSFLMYEEHQMFDPPNEAAHREAVEALGDAAVGLFNWLQRSNGC